MTTTITATYQLKLSGDPATCALVASHLLDYLREAAADIQDTILECGHPPYDDNWDEHIEAISLGQALFEAWNSNSWQLDVARGSLGIHADAARRQGDTVAAAAEIDAYVIRNVRNRDIGPASKIDILRVATSNAIYQTLADDQLLGNLTARDIAAGHRLLLNLLEERVSIDYTEAA
jgi:hypothetical protein